MRLTELMLDELRDSTRPVVSTSWHQPQHFSGLPRRSAYVARGEIAALAERVI